MKQIKIIALVAGILATGFHAKAQSEEVQQLLLNIEKLAQFKQILSDMKKGYTILSNGYGTIKNLSQGNFNLHKAFLDALMEVSPTVRNYKRIADIIKCQKSIISEYKSAYNRIRTKNLLQKGELDYISNVYSSLVSKSLSDIEDLTLIVTAGKLRMSDDERIQSIDRIYASIQDKLSFLRSFNNTTSVLLLQREKEQQDARVMRAIHGIKQ